ncbi:unnamed protein product [Cunninghamella blakesleeana]
MTNNIEPLPNYLPLKYNDLPPRYDPLQEATLNKEVNVNNCYYYLSLIERFWHYMNTMNKQEQQLYLARAEYRYELWVKKFHYNMLAPPLDIAYVWHAHLLSPFRYYEDIAVRLGNSSMYNAPFPLKDIHENQIVYTNKKSNLKMKILAFWDSTFGADEPYCLKKEDLYIGSFQRKCWLCKHEIKIPWTEYADYRYGKNTNSFPHHCKPEGMSFLDLASMKLEFDIKNIRGNKALGPRIAGTLLDAKGRLKKKGNKIIPFINHLPNISKPGEMDYAYEVQIENVLKTLGPKYEYHANELMYAIRTCYQSNPSPFSIDLIHAVSRQKKFYDNIKGIDWKPPKGFTSAIRRYHDFLVLMKRYPTIIAVPTIEIDCAWHTHMLFAKKYRDFTLNYLKRHINHDDTIPDSSLKQYASKTNNAWLNLNLQYRLLRWEKKGIKIHATITPATNYFGDEYIPGKVEIPFDSLKKIQQILNDQLTKACTERQATVKFSAHCHDLKDTFYRDNCDLEQLKDMQVFIGEGMKKTSYGYVGTVNCGTGGKSAIYCDESRSYSGKEISSYKDKWYKVGDPRTKTQNIFRDVEGSKCNSEDFVDVAPPEYSAHADRRRKSNMNHNDATYLDSNQAMFLTTPMILYASPAVIGCGSAGGFGGCGGGFGGCGGGGGGGGCGGGGGGGGGCGGGGGGGGC